MWPFSTPYPIRRLDEISGSTYDYIVVGGGTAGSALASRLSEDSTARVLLLERGPFNDTLVSRIPAASVANGSYTVNRDCVPDEGAGNRDVKILTAETIGGNSRINAMIYTRGTPAYYERWGESHPTWNWEHVEPYFEKVEEKVSLRQTEHLESGIYPHLEKSAAALGLPCEKEGNRPEAPSSGYFNLDLTIDGSGYRHSALRAYLPQELAQSRQDSLHICTGVVVAGLDLDSGKGVVNGVFVQPAGPDTGSDPVLIKARREVILTAGAICNPQILQLSGIGPQKQLDDLGIAVSKDLPGVGTHLGDHFLIPVFVEVPIHDTLQQLLANPLVAAKHALLWATTGQGWLKSTVDRVMYISTKHIDKDTGLFQANGSSLDPRKAENLPDVELMVVPICSKPEEHPGKPLFTLQVCLNQTKSKGSVSIKSRNPKDDPEIRLNMLEDVEDLQTARKALRFALHLAEHFSFQSEYPHQARPFGGPGSGEWSEGDWQRVSDDDLDAYARKYISPVFHLTSTCRMGKEDEGGVVDEELRVYGFKNLRIADASILPTVTAAHPMAPAYMVAERCADLIQMAWKE